MRESQTVIKVKGYFYRFISLFTSLVTGWIIYIFGIMVFPHDGIVAISFQTLIGAIITSILVMLSWIIGLFIRKYLPVRLLPGYRLHLIIIIISLFFLFFGYRFGLKEQYVNLETGTSFENIDSLIGISAYFLIIFFIANWPIKVKDNSSI